MKLRGRYDAVLRTLATLVIGITLIPLGVVVAVAGFLADYVVNAFLDGRKLGVKFAKWIER